LLRLDGRLDGEVLRLLPHEDCSSRHRKDNSENDGRRDPQQALRLGDFGARRDGALNLRLGSGRHAGAVEFGRDFRGLGPLHGFVATGRDHRRRAGLSGIIRPARPDRPAWV
jgi:hypothetical protein